MSDNKGKEAHRKKRADWLNNNIKISDALVSFQKDHKRFPTYAEISKLTGLGLATINAHFEDLDFDEMFEDNRKLVTVLSQQVFMSLYNQALKGNVRAIELLMQVNYKWAKPQVFEHKIGDSSAPSKETQEMIDKGMQLMEELRKEREMGKKNADKATSSERPESTA